MNSNSNSKLNIEDKNKDNLNSKELFSKSSNTNSMKNEILTIEIPKLEENKKREIFSKKRETNNRSIYLVLSLLLEQYSYNKILDSMIKIKEERYFTKLDKIINILIKTKGYSYFIKELITVKNDIDNINIKQKEEKKEKNRRTNSYKNIINIEDKDDSSNNDDNSFISKKENIRKKKMYSLRTSRNLNKQLYLDSISDSEEESLENIDDLEISLEEEEKKESEIENEIEQEKSESRDSSSEQKIKKIIDLSKKTKEKKNKNNNIDFNDKNYDIEIDLINQKEEKHSTSRQKYYQKGGKYGMHYYLSDKDNKIYKYYSVQYNGDKSIGFRCADTSCRSKAILFPKSKEFKIISNHTLKFEEHKKLQGSMKNDRFIKAMENNNLKEIQLTKKDNIKEILWFK